MKLSEKIIMLRNKYQMSQGDLAEKLNVSRQSVSKWETGASIPDLDKMIAMSELFHVTLDELAKESVEIGSENKSEPLQMGEPFYQKETRAEDASMHRLAKAGERFLPLVGGIMMLLSILIIMILRAVGLVTVGLLIIPGYAFFCGLLCLVSKKNVGKKILIGTIAVVVIYILVCWIEYLARL